MALDLLSDSNSHQLVDKLRTIRPFTESQLLTLYNNIELDSNQQFINNFVEENIRNDCNKLYQLLVKLSKCREKHETTNNRVEQLKTNAEELQQKVWQLNNKSIVRNNRCSDGRLVEAVHKYSESVLNNENLKKLDKTHLWLKECVSNDNCINYYLSQLVRLEIENFLIDIINEKDFNSKSKQLRNAISALFAYQRRALMLRDKQLIKTTLNWLLNISAELLSIATLDDNLFLLNHILRCAAGSSVWSSCLIQCPNPLYISDSELSNQYMNHCVTLISTILSPIKMREKFIGIVKNKKNKKLDSDETWHLVDPEINGEDVTNSYVEIAELDVIRFLKQIPFNDVLKFASMNESSNDVSNSNSFGESTEIKMLKLLAFSTKLIQILRQGLHSFNCLRFKELTVYISSMIRRTVLAVSELWLNCKTHFMSEDQAMILRLQVEFDHFMLRSMIAILTTNRQGVWNFLSVFPFNGVSESMMWHILWVVYNNGRDELDELGGLCPYFSVNYWKNKFQETTVQYLFKEKLSSLTLSESQNLLTLMYNMAISRNGSENEYISTIIKEVFAISLQSPQLSENMTEKGKQIVIKLISRHNSLISVLIRQLLNNESNNSVGCIELFCEIPLHLWNPNDDDIDLLSEWLATFPIGHLLNRIARIVFSRLNWSYDSTNKKLFIELEKHQKIALDLFVAFNGHNLAKSQKDFINSNSKLFGSEALLSFAQSIDSNDFMKWVWNLLITLKLHRLEWDEHFWDQLSNDEEKDPKNDNVLQLNFDTNLIPICRGIEEQNPFALYLALVMTDFGQTKSIEKCMEALEALLTAQHNIPAIHLLFTFIPFHLKHYKTLTSSPKLINLFSHLFSEYNKEIVSMISHQLSKFNDKQNKLELLICWTEVLNEVIGSIIKTNANSWFSSGQSRLQQIAYIFDKISIFIYLDQNLRQLFLKYLSENPYDIQSWKLPTGGWFSSLFSWGSTSIKKCEWITPLHLIHKQNPNYISLGWLLIESDAIRTEKIWDQIVNEISANSETNIEFITRAICLKHNHSPIPLSLIPINSWSSLLINSSVKPPNDLEPLLWFKFFQLFFTTSDSSHSIGLKFIGEEKRKKMITKLNSLIDFHHSLWLSSDPNNSEKNSIDDRLAKLYRAYILWLEDSQLHEVFVNTDELPPQYLKDLLKCAIANTDCQQFSDNYLNLKRIQTEVSKIYNLWLELHSTALLSDKVCDESEPNYQIEDEKAVNVPEVKKSNLDSFNIDLHSINNSSALLLLIQHNVRVVLEEAKYFENLLNKFEDLNKDLMKGLPDLYHNIKKEIKLKIGCDKDNYDPNGCTGPYSFNIEFIEGTLNQHSLKSIEKNRIDFENIVSQLIETPSNKVVLASLFIEKSIPLLIESYDFQNCEKEIERSLLGSLLTWLNDTNYLYPPSKQVFTNLIDSLGSIAEVRADETNQFVLETAINNPKIIEYMAPRLLPSQTSTQCFLDMYRLIQEKLTKTPPQVSFVLLSKFDVSVWFRNASHEQSLSLIQILGNALNSFGNKPKEEYSMVFGLYRKHLQYAIIYQFPHYLSEVLLILLKGMKSLSIAPCLWNDVLMSFGFFMNKEEIVLSDFYLELKKYSNNQPLFTSNELYDILTILSTDLFEAYNNIPQEFLDHFKSYIKTYLTLLSTLSFCWLNANSRMPPCDINNVWRPFYNNWNVWVFPKRSTRFINSDNFQLVWDLFLININYFIECFQGMLSSILSCVWQVVLSYIIGTKAIDSKDLLIIQSKIQALNWNKFCPNISDIKLMYEAVIQDQYSIEPFIAYVFSRIDWRHTLQNQSLTVEQMALIVENMSYTMISLSNEKCSVEIDLNSIPFELLTATKVQSISQVIVRIIKLKSYFFEANNNMSHGFLITLLKQICLLSITDSDLCDRDWLLKHKFYANSVSYLIKDLSSGDNDLVTKYPNEIKKFIKQCFEDLKPTFQSDIEKSERIELFSELLKCLNGLSDEEIRKIVTEQYSNGFNFERPQIICDLIQSTAQTVRHIPSFLTLSETYISQYFTFEGNVSELIQIFQIPDNTDDFMVASVTRSASLTLITYLLTKLSTSEDSKRFVSNFMNWCSQLRPNADDESKVLLLWFKLLTISESLIDSEENSMELIQSIQRFCKSLFDIVEETVYQGFLSFMRTNRKAFSERCTLLILCLSLNGIKHLNDCITRSSPLTPDLNSIYKSALNKLQSLKKNKSFVELLPLIENMSSVLERNQSSVESTQLISHWLTTFYSDNCFLKAFL